MMCYRHFVEFGNKNHTNASGKNGKKTTTLEKKNYQVFSINEAKHFALEYKWVKLPHYSTNLPAVHFSSWQRHKADYNPPPQPFHCLKLKMWKKKKPEWPVLSSNTTDSHMTTTPRQTTATVVSVLERHISISRRVN